MKLLQEVRKEDELYYQGAFWIKGNSVIDVKKGNFEIIGIKLPSHYDGSYTSDIVRSKSSLTHKRLWPEYADELIDKEYDYLPRGRVSIYQGTAFIHLNSLFNQPNIIDTIIQFYNIKKLEIYIDLNDTYQGSHYDFKLK